MEIKIEKDADPKRLAKLKDLIETLNGVFPETVIVRDVMVIETKNQTIFKLLKDYGTAQANKPKYECPQCHKMVEIITKEGVCRPCLMNNARKRAEQRQVHEANVDNPISAVRVG